MESILNASQNEFETSSYPSSQKVRIMFRRSFLVILPCPDCIFHEQMFLGLVFSFSYSVLEES